MGRPRKQEIVLSELERGELGELVRSRTAAHGLVRRARIVLASAEGVANTAIARELGLSIPAVGHWRKRFLEHGLAGLYGEQRPGRPRSHDDAAVAGLLATVLRRRPTVGTHWTVRGAAEASGISKSAVQRYFRLFGPATSLQELQAVDGPAFRREGSRHRRPLSQPAGQRRRPMHR